MSYQLVDNSDGLRSQSMKVHKFMHTISNSQSIITGKNCSAFETINNIGYGEALLISTHNICFHGEIRKISLFLG